MILPTSTDIKVNPFLDGKKIEKFRKVAIIIDNKLGFKTHTESICRTVKYKLHVFKHR